MLLLTPPLTPPLPNGLLFPPTSGVLTPPLLLLLPPFPATGSKTDGSCTEEDESLLLSLWLLLLLTTPSLASVCGIEEVEGSAPAAGSEEVSDDVLASVTAGVSKVLSWRDVV